METGSFRVCIVEDDIKQFQVIQKVLQKAPFENTLTHLSTGEELLDRQISEEFDLILLDYKLPGKDGIEVIKEIRGREILIPIVLISAYETEKVIASALEMGADDFIIKDLSGNYLKILNFMLTKTMKKYQLQQENIKLQQEMLYSQKMQSISTLAQGIAHDFNNALVGIIGYSDLLKIKFSKDDESYICVERIYSSAKRMATWVKQLLAYSKSGEHKLHPLLLNILIQKCIQMINPSLEKRIQIFTSLDHNLKKMEGDRNQIEQVITNILLNSIESIQGHGEIRVLTENVGSISLPKTKYYKKIAKAYVHLLIEDTGIGMDRETMSRIFEPFFSTKFIGRGLGMAAVYGIIDNHNGDISIESEPGKGTKVEIYFPVHEVVSEPVKIAKRIDTQQASILVVDDEIVTIEIVRKVFQDKGYNILEARDGIEALEVYKNGGNISLVILDLIMPKKDGIELFRDIKQLNPNQKILICSGYDKDAIQNLAQEGASGFILKPFTIPEIIEKVQTVLGK